MSTVGIVRRIDELGRIVIPKEIRKQIKVENKVDSFEIFTDGDTIVLKKFQPTCVFCGSFDDSVNLNGYNVCKNCIQKLQELAQGLE